jgi:tRNA threonylcarbamoyladenosine biosynthesis protein TsaB
VTRILALDTTSEFGSLALTGGGELVAEELMRSPGGFGHVLFGRVREMLDRHGWKLEDIDCFAAASGPGSFTGVRVGLAAVKGLAEALGKPVVPVSNLEAVAWFGAAPLRAAAIDARRGQIYGAVYSAALEIVSPEVVAPLAAWLEALPSGELEFLSPDLPGPPFRETPRAQARAIAAIAAERLRLGRALDPAEVDANYVRRSDAELFWKEPS